MTDGDIIIKRGATLPLSLTVRDDEGRPVDLTGYVITSQIRDAREELIASLPISIPTPTTGVALADVTDTSSWPIGILRCDVKFALGDVVIISETFPIQVQRAVTR